MTKLLLVGGHPKGHNIPFHPDTLSGKRLRGLVEKHKLNVEYLDLFTNKKTEDAGLIREEAFFKVQHAKKKGIKIIALGRYVYECLLIAGIYSEYLPHPASRRKVDLQKLEQGLVNFTN